jgi:formate--tetrahydrofolate ligase
MPSSLEIAQEAELRPIAQIAEALGLSEDEYDPYGRFKAKVSLSVLDRLSDQPDGKLIDVTAITPTKAGEGKTTTSVSLTQGLGHIGKNPVLCLREASLGPVFGIKGGAAGGGYAQVVPMEDMNLHFTGDIHAIGAANNLLAALLEAHMLHGNKLGIDRSRSRGGAAWTSTTARFAPSSSGLAAAPTAMSARQASTSRLRPRSWPSSPSRATSSTSASGSGRSRSATPGRASRSRPSSSRLPARWPSCSRTRSCRTSCRRSRASPRSSTAARSPTSRTATTPSWRPRTGLKLGDYTVTESGFGSDMGMEKFFDIVCRVGGLRPNAVVLVATSRALKHHGDDPDGGVDAIERGAANMHRHLGIVKEFGLNAVVAINRFPGDTDEEVDAVKRLALEGGAMAAELNEAFERGGEGAAALAEAVVAAAEAPSDFKPGLRARPADRRQDRGDLQACVRRRGRRLSSCGAAGDRALQQGRLRQAPDLHGEDAPVAVARPVAS